MGSKQASIEHVRAFFARLMAAASRSADPRLERIFELVPREAFLPPGPWQIVVNQHYVETPSADPVFIYQNVLVALDAQKGINNGEPFLHAAWIGVAEPRPGDRICHIGAGTGYYTAILSLLSRPGGKVFAYEIDQDLALKARTNLKPYDNVDVIAGDATSLPMARADLIYVNAGVVAPPAIWLQALSVQGRMIFPWRPADRIGLAVLLTRKEHGFEARPLMFSWFIPSVGASDMLNCLKPPDSTQARTIRSAWLTEEREPDASAVATYTHMWFSSAPL